MKPLDALLNEEQRRRLLRGEYRLTDAALQRLLFVGSTILAQPGIITGEIITPQPAAPGAELPPAPTGGEVPAGSTYVSPVGTGAPGLTQEPTQLWGFTTTFQTQAAPSNYATRVLGHISRPMRLRNLFFVAYANFAATAGWGLALVAQGENSGVGGATRPNGTFLFPWPTTNSANAALATGPVVTTALNVPYSMDLDLLISDTNTDLIFYVEATGAAVPACTFNVRIAPEPTQTLQNLLATSIPTAPSGPSVTQIFNVGQTTKTAAATATNLTALKQRAKVELSPQLKALAAAKAAEDLRNGINTIIYPHTIYYGQPLTRDGWPTNPMTMHNDAEEIDFRIAHAGEPIKDTVIHSLNIDTQIDAWFKRELSKLMAP
jgi:hypothetical protein